MVDFGADHAFSRVNDKLKEHYGIELSLSIARNLTLHHARTMQEKQIKELGQVQGKRAEKYIISETDGTMIPIVKTTQAESDRRKKKSLCYREARLTLAHAKGSKTPIFSATLEDVETVGKHIAHCIHQVGLNKETKIHAVGDGATWIADQMDIQFGQQSTYLIDFYHLCQYLNDAATGCVDNENKMSWIEKQKRLLKDNQANTVLENLRPHLETQSSHDQDMPVKSCYQYIHNRINQLDYKTAIENGLPIGSGEIESAHRYVIQKRLKIQGAWWLEFNADALLALRTQRANHRWNHYWTQLAA